MAVLKFGLEGFKPYQFISIPHPWVSKEDLGGHWGLFKKWLSCSSFSLYNKLIKVKSCEGHRSQELVSPAVSPGAVTLWLHPGLPLALLPPLSFVFSFSLLFLFSYHNCTQHVFLLFILNSIIFINHVFNLKGDEIFCIWLRSNSP